jgi:hypothetical protein
MSPVSTAYARSPISRASRERSATTSRNPGEHARQREREEARGEAGAPRIVGRGRDDVGHRNRFAATQLGRGLGQQLGHDGRRSRRGVQRDSVGPDDERRVGFAVS